MNSRARRGWLGAVAGFAVAAWRVAADPANPAANPTPAAAEPAAPPAEAAAAAATNAPEAPAAGRGRTAKPPERGAYERKVAASIFPDVPQKNPASTWLTGFRFGPTDQDAVYLLLECSDLETRADRMFVWSPTLPKFQTPDLRRASGAKSLLLFRSFEVPLTWGDYKGGARVEIQVRAKTRGRNCARAEIELSKGSNRVRCELGRPNLVGLAERAGNLPVLPFDGEPRLVFDVAAGGRVVVADIQVGEWKLLPGPGMDNAIRVDIVNATSQTVDRVKLKPDPLFFLNTPAWTGDVRRLPAGQTFRYRAEINLGGPFGVLRAEKEIATPAAAP